MTKTKRQLRAEAVERLKRLQDRSPIFDSDIGSAIADGGLLSDVTDLLTDDDSTIAETESTIELLSDGADSREKLEADVLKYYTHTVSTAMWPPSANKHTDMVSVSMDTVLEWLDRQAAITEEKTRYKWVTASAEEIAAWRSKAEKLKEQVYELTAERDKLINAINELQKKQPYCYNPKQPLDTLNTIGRYINELTAERDELRDELAATKKHLKVAQGQLSVTLNNWEQAKGKLRRQKEALDERAAKLDERDAKTADEIAAEEIDRWKAKAEKARDDAETWRKACGDVLDAADEIHRIMAYHFPNGR